MSVLGDILSKLLDLREIAESTVEAALLAKVETAEKGIATFRQNAVDETVAKAVEKISDPVLAAIISEVLTAEVGAVIDQGVDRGVNSVWDLVESINPKDKPGPAPDLTP